MAITPKPFNWAEKIRRTIFAGRPSVFSAQDINRQFDAIYSFQDKLSAMTGPLRENWVITDNGISVGVVGPNRVLSVDVTLAKINLVAGAYMYKDGVRFTIPLSNLTGSFSFAANSPVEAYIYLIAEQATITFGDEPVMSGINSTEFPSSLPSADNIIYRNERLVLNDGSVLPTLGSGEVIIGIIGSIVEFIRTTADGSDEGASFRGIEIRYNSSTIQDLIDKIPLDDTIGGTSTKVFKGNSSFMDFCNTLLDYIKQNITKLKAQMSGLRTDVDVIVADSLDNAKLNTANVFSKSQTEKLNLATFNVGTGAITLGEGNHFELVIASDITASDISKIGTGTMITLVATGSGTLTLQHGGTIKCPTGQDLVLQVNDYVVLLQKASSVWSVVAGSYKQASVTATLIEVFTIGPVTTGGVTQYATDLAGSAAPGITRLAAATYDRALYVWTSVAVAGAADTSLDVENGIGTGNFVQLGRVGEKEASMVIIPAGCEFSISFASLVSYTLNCRIQRLSR